MKKSILDVPGVKILEKKAQSNVNGGYNQCSCGNFEFLRCLCHASE